jgi:DNA-directed RNA polymerase subunit RPC12/RpoP
MARNCPHCDSEMFEEYDHINKVRVLVCSRPTCLFRSYPDYPRRKGNEEVCYKCQRIFKLEENDAGILCPECKANVEQNKKTPANGKQQKPYKASGRETLYSENNKAKMRRAI